MRQTLQQVNYQRASLNCINKLNVFTKYNPCYNLISDRKPCLATCVFFHVSGISNSSFMSTVKIFHKAKHYNIHPEAKYFVR